MLNPSFDVLDTVFHARSIALAGITINNPEHWTRSFLDALIHFDFKGKIYLINPRGGEIKGLKVYPSLDDIPGTADYVISTVPARAAVSLVEACARKRIKAVHFCTAGFAETGEPEGRQMEAELAAAARKTGVRILGPNCMGLYCPESRISYHPGFVRESGHTGLISQSGGNATGSVIQAGLRGVRFSKVVSYGNACDLNESDYLEYLTRDPDTRIIGMYMEGVRDGSRFRQALENAAKAKPVIMLKGGVTRSGSRAAAGHTGALAGSLATWEALCKQSGVLRAESLPEFIDVLVTYRFQRLPRGKKVALIGLGGGASVLITDEFERRGMEVPPLPAEIRDKLREYSPLAGNILGNPLDYSQSVWDTESMTRTVSLLSQWDGVDLLLGYVNPSQAQRIAGQRIFNIVDVMLEGNKAGLQPIAMVLEPSVVPEEAAMIMPLINKCIEARVPVYFSFANAARALSLVLSRDSSRSPSG